MRIAAFILFVFYSVNNCLGQVTSPGSELWYYDIISRISADSVQSLNWNSTIENDGFRRPSRMHGSWYDFIAGQNGKEKSLSILPVRLATTYNSRFPVGSNDGATWQGKGLNINASAGFKLNSGVFRMTVYPQFNLSNNSSFFIPDNRSSAPFNYPFSSGIDWVQAFGSSSYRQFNLGQSEARLVIKNFTFGISSANEAWGPAIYNPILLGVNSAGVPRIELGTFEPLDIKIGLAEAKLFWGIMEDSDFSNEGSRYDNRYLQGLSVSYQPVFLKNLTLGINRVMYRNWFTDENPFDSDDAIPTLSTFFSFNKEPDTLNGGAVNDLYDQMASVSMSWKFPEVGFEAYLEFARNDFSGDLVDFLLEPEHSRGYTIGFIKNIELEKDRLLSVGYEHTNLSRSKSFQIRATPPFYQHHIVRQGYTINGQILGSAIGPGSSADNLTANIYGPRGGLGLRITRTRFNDDYFFSLPDVTFDDHDVQYDVALSGTRIKGKYMITGSMEWNYRFNWYFDTDRDVSNLRASISITRIIN